MDDLQDFIDETQNAEDLGALAWWTPTSKTPSIVGRVLEYRQVNTEYGQMRGAALELVAPAVVQDSAKDQPRLAEPGENVMIWHKNTVLRNMWAVPSSGGGPPAVGEIVGVKHTGTRRGNRGEYPTFIVRVKGRDGAALAAANGAGETEDVTAEDPSIGNPAWPTQDESEDLPF